MISLLRVGCPGLLTLLLVFGFAPGVVLRVIVLAFPRNDRRRRELLGELYAVPRADQPFWVVQQLELAIFEGLGGRLRKAVRHRSPRRASMPSGNNMDTAARVLALAQQTADQAIADSRREAVHTLARARREADGILREARREAKEILPQAQHQARPRRAQPGIGETPRQP